MRRNATAAFAMNIFSDKLRFEEPCEPQPRGPFANLSKDVLYPSSNMSETICRTEPKWPLSKGKTSAFDFFGHFIWGGDFYLIFVFEFFESNSRTNDRPNNNKFHIGDSCARIDRARNSIRHPLNPPSTHTPNRKRHRSSRSSQTPFTVNS